MSEILAGRYQLGAVIGRGGMSEVYSATDTLLGREVAVKMLRGDLVLDANFRERFRREAQNSGRLNHPNIVAVYDTGESHRSGLNTPYIVMELVHGRTLRDVIDQEGPLPPHEAAQLLLPVCHALETSHAAGIIHRDIKPANIMITNTGAVKIMDFGIARALDDATSAMTQTSAVIGTAQYLSPEQARGKLADARSDIYALGCVMYETITGKPPFQGETPFAVAYQHVQEDPVRPSERIPNLSTTEAVNVDAVVLTSMAKHPGDRYQTAADFAADLERLERRVVTEAARHYVEPTTAPADPTTTTQVAAAAASAPAAAPAASGRRRKASGRHASPEAQEKRRGSHRLLKVLATILGVIILGTGAAFAYDYLRNGSDSAPETITVPNTEGQDRTAATQALRDLGFEVSVEEEANPKVDRNKVIRSNPTAGSSLQRGSMVTLTVSAGEEVISVPDVKGVTTEVAQQRLTKAGLVLDPTVNERTSDTVAVGDVIEQSPTAGARIAKGSKVSIVVSSGVPTARVPSVKGLQWEQAQDNLRAMGFVPQKREVDSKEPAGTVLDAAQEGQTINRGATVEVEVSNGQLITMPNIVGQLPEQAVATLRRAGWTGDLSKLPAGGPVPTPIITDQNKVATQNPPAGQPVRKDATIPVQLYRFDLAALAP